MISSLWARVIAAATSVREIRLVATERSRPLPFQNRNLLLGQTVQLIHQGVDLPIGYLDLALEQGLVEMSLLAPSPLRKWRRSPPALRIAGVI